VLSSRAVDGHQLYSGGSVVDKASTVGIEISPSPPLIFTGSQKLPSLASFSASLNFEPPAFEHAARFINSETKRLCRNDRHMSSPSFMKLGPRNPQNSSVKVPHSIKLHGENVLITQP